MSWCFAHGTHTVRSGELLDGTRRHGDGVGAAMIESRWRARIDASHIRAQPELSAPDSRAFLLTFSAGGRQHAAEPKLRRDLYVTINMSRTEFRPGAIHAASWARSRAYQDPTAPSSVTKPSTTLTRIKRASRSALRLSARSMATFKPIVCG